jgi:hypothetical protein
MASGSRLKATRVENENFPILFYFDGFLQGNFHFSREHAQFKHMIKIKDVN